MRSPIIALRDRRADRGQHPGLLLQRYLCDGAPAADGNPNEKHALLKAAIDASRDEEFRAIYRIAFDRWSAALPGDPAPVDLATAGRLIVGLGSENVLETGVRLHHTYGMPVIPGSALKGLAAHYCDQVWGQRQVETAFEEARRFRGQHRDDKQRDQQAEMAGEYHRLLFGGSDENGCITFHDAWLTPDSPQPLVLDVMTPHHANWLDGPDPPSDFDSPTPLPFLAVTGVFRLAVSWHGPAGEKDKDKAKGWAELARSLLCDALKDWGIGGKTTSGYGRIVALKDVPIPSTPASRPTEAPPPIAKPLPVKPLPAKRAAKRAFGTRATVTFLGPREGRPGFRAEEQGIPEGILNQGVQPPQLPEVNQEIQVFIHDDAASPQYRWDGPATVPDRRPGGRGDRRPGGRR